MSNPELVGRSQHIVLLFASPHFQLPRVQEADELQQRLGGQRLQLEPPFLSRRRGRRGGEPLTQVGAESGEDAAVRRD